MTPAKRRKPLRSRPAIVGAAMFSAVAWAEISRSLGLSPREMEIAHGVFDNLTEGAIAANLHLSEHTVHAHLNRLFRKLRATTRVQMVLRITSELLILTLSNDSQLPPICRNRANGRCRLIL